jgi:hypothetical protein
LNWARKNPRGKSDYKGEEGCGKFLRRGFSIFKFINHFLERDLERNFRDNELRFIGKKENCAFDRVLFCCVRLKRFVGQQSDWN